MTGCECTSYSINIYTIVDAFIVYINIHLNQMLIENLLTPLWQNLCFPFYDEALISIVLSVGGY